MCSILASLDHSLENFRHDDAPAAPQLHKFPCVVHLLIKPSVLFRFLFLSLKFNGAMCYPVHLSLLCAFLQPVFWRFEWSSSFYDTFHVIHILRQMLSSLSSSSHDVRRGCVTTLHRSNLVSSWSLLSRESKDLVQVGSYITEMRSVTLGLLVVKSHFGLK